MQEQQTVFFFYPEDVMPHLDYIANFPLNLDVASSRALRNHFVLFPMNRKN